jgi:hypothetical protein
MQIGCIEYSGSQEVAMRRKPYATDLSDAEWNLIKDLFPPEKPGGRHRITDLRREEVY